MASLSFERDSSFFILVAFITFDILLVSLTAGSITIFLYLKVGLPAIHSVIEPAAYKKACTNLTQTSYSIPKNLLTFLTNTSVINK